MATYEGQVIGEVGQLDDTLSQTPKTVMLDRSYTNPVVFAQPLSLDGGSTSIVRLTDVQADRFTLYVQEAPNRDGDHTREAVSYVVLEAGQWELSSGAQLHVSSVDTAATVGQGMTPGTGTWFGHAYEAGTTADAATQSWYTLDFAQAFGQAPRFVGTLGTYDGGDGAYVRYERSSLTVGGVQVMLEEDTTYDSETNHTTEVVHYLAIEGDGLLMAADTRTYTPFMAYEEEISSAGTIQRTTHLIAGQMVAVRVAGDPDPEQNGLYYIYTDHLGSSSVIVKESGEVVADRRYYPFGAPRSGDLGGVTDRGYISHRENESVGLIYMNARYYAPALGRFLSADTVVPDPGNPQSLNRFAYSLNNPVKYRDPTGHCVDGLSTAACVLLAGIFLKVAETGNSYGDLSLWSPLSYPRIDVLNGARVTPPTSSNMTAWLVNQMITTSNSQIVEDMAGFWNGTISEQFGALAAWTAMVTILPFYSFWGAVTGPSATYA